MIRDAKRALSGRPNNRPAVILRGRSEEGTPTISVNSQSYVAGNPAYTDPHVLRMIAAELLQAASWLERERANR